uniref:SRF-like protein n=1 Tax=Mycena chlorophos TaxID=658473 RepID=A0ABQ0LCI5_MYCCL|nr:SRF-like protein [Mycena chlorophos]
METSDAADDRKHRDPRLDQDLPSSLPRRPAHPPPTPSAMGRRKIEIQPITHERNRSVTFVKRKLGLMKKAYELGVLCSVDVAVIIFEDRPGQEPKLFQYCSTNMRNMIARHGEHDGERDTKGPSDFSGADKNEDAVGEDDDEVEDDDPPPPPPKKKAKPNKDDMEYRGPGTNSSNMAIPSPPIRKLSTAASSKNKTTIPTSSDRHSTRPTRNGGGKKSPPAKKARTEKSPEPKEESSDEELSEPPRRRREPAAPSLSPPPDIGSGITLPPPSSMASMYNLGPPPMGRFGSGYPGGPPPPGAPPYFPSIFDLPGPSSLPPISQSRGQYDPSMLEQLLRSAAAQRAGFAGGSSPFGVDWPVHSHPPPPPPPGLGLGLPPNLHSGPPGAAAGDAPSSNWFDYLSVPPPPPASVPSSTGLPPLAFNFNGLSNAPPPNISRSASTTSWERAGSVGGAATAAAGATPTLKRAASTSGSISESEGPVVRMEDKD